MSNHVSPAFHAPTKLRNEKKGIFVTYERTGLRQVNIVRLTPLAKIGIGALSILLAASIAYAAAHFSNAALHPAPNVTRERTRLLVRDELGPEIRDLRLELAELNRAVAALSGAVDELVRQVHKTGK